MPSRPWGRSSSVRASPGAFFALVYALSIPFWLLGAQVGMVWAAWHIVPLVQQHRPPAWIAGGCLGTVGNRVLIVWLYNVTGKSVFAAALYHTMLNVSWQLFPNQGSHYDPRVSGVVVAIVATAVAMLWKQGRRTQPA